MSNQLVDAVELAAFRSRKTRIIKFLNCIGSHFYQSAISASSGASNSTNTGRSVESSSHGQVQFLQAQDILYAKDCAPFTVKIDIGGYENDLFLMDVDWIDLFPVLLIQLHDWVLSNHQATCSILREVFKSRRNFMHFDKLLASIVSDFRQFIDL